MNDLKEEKGTREELRRSQAAPRRSGGGLKRALMVILALVVVLAVVVAAAWKDLSSLDSVRRLFSYNKVTQDVRPQKAAGTAGPSAPARGGRRSSCGP